MKVLLAIVMSAAFTISALAISGGPWSGGSRVTVTGTYAGVMVPGVTPTPAPTATPPDATPTPAPTPTPTPDNSLALFTVKIPQTGLGSGTVAVFRNGIFYNGTMTASADPDSGKLSATIFAIFLQISSVSSGTDSSSVSIKSEYDANGQLDKTKIVGKSVPGSTSAARIRGTGSLTYKNIRNDSEPVDEDGQSHGAILYKVRGFKQSESTD